MNNHSIAETPLLNQINFPYTLAPMVGLSHIALRALIREYTPLHIRTIWPTEMLNSRRLMVQNLGHTPETLKLENEDGLVPQILGNEARPIGEAVRKLKAWGAQAIDINMGCPVKKALRHNYGVALMEDPSYAAEVVRMTVDQTDLPVSVKLRAGMQRDQKVLHQTVENLVQAGASWICLHPRTAAEKRRGNADWDQIKKLKESIDVPIIGNGDVQNIQDALAMKEQTGCDMVMIGRALCARPWLLWQLAYHIDQETTKKYKDGVPPITAQEEAQEYGKALIRFVQLCQNYFEEKDAWKKIRFFIRVSHVWHNFGHRLNSIAHKAESFEDLEEKLQEFFERPGHSMSARSDLRY